MTIILRYLFIFISLTLYTFAENAETFHKNYWTIHLSQSNTLIAYALKSSILTAKTHPHNKEISYNLCSKTEKKCDRLHFNYHFESLEEGNVIGLYLSELSITLTTNEGKLIWQRNTSFYDHDALSSVLSWPHYNRELLYDGSIKTKYFKCTYGYEHCSETVNYDLMEDFGLSSIDSFGSQWATKERKHWAAEQFNK